MQFNKQLFKRVFWFGALFGVLCVWVPPAIAFDNLQANQTLAKTICQDASLDQVLNASEKLLTKGLTAGGHYRQVWIRDLNTFIEPALRLDNGSSIRNSLLLFFHLQDQNGSIADGYVPVKDEAPDLKGQKKPDIAQYKKFKNTVESDQESSLLQAVYKYVQASGDRSILLESIQGRTVLHRLGQALHYLMRERLDATHGLLWGGTTADWGDVQPEDDPGIELSDQSHRAISIYNNAMLVIALQNYIELVAADRVSARYWQKQLEKLQRNIRTHLWHAGDNKFIPHVYLQGSPFPAGFDEQAIHFYGGTVVAMQADLLTPAEKAAVYDKFQRHIALVPAQTVGLTLYPAYPNGFFKNPQMGAYSYQNGGEWDWFGGRWIPQLLAMGRPDLAYAALQPLTRRVVRHGFNEWFTVNGQTRGAKDFRGAAGVLNDAVRQTRLWARTYRGVAACAIDASGASKPR